MLAYGGQSPGDASLLELASTHLPILLVMLVACVNVGTLVYARTATRDAEIAMRFALGASRTRIVTQLFVEALVLSAVAAAVGLIVAHVTLIWATHAFNSGDTGGLPFWGYAGLSRRHPLRGGADDAAAAILGVLPALKATRAASPRAAAQSRRRRDAPVRQGLDRRDDPPGGLRGHLPHASPGHLEEALRDRQIRGPFPAKDDGACGWTWTASGSAVRPRSPTRPTPRDMR